MVELEENVYRGMQNLIQFCSSKHKPYSTIHKHAQSRIRFCILRYTKSDHRNINHMVKPPVRKRIKAALSSS